MRRALAALLAAPALAGCGGLSDDLKRVTDQSSLPVYFAGRSFEGLSLTHVEGSGGRAAFGYGTCVAESDSGCPLPVQIQQRPTDGRGLRLDVPCRIFELRGVPARRADGTEIATGSVVVKVYAATAARERRVIDALHAIGDPAKPASRLPPPDFPLAAFRACGA